MLSWSSCVATNITRRKQVVVCQQQVAVGEERLAAKRRAAGQSKSKMLDSNKQSLRVGSATGVPGSD